MLLFEFKLLIPTKNPKTPVFLYLEDPCGKRVV